MQSTPKEIELYFTPDGDCPYSDWHRSLRDKRTRAIVTNRITRLEAGLMGDFKALGNGVCELRIDYGPGWRVYFAIKGDQVVLLLCGSGKSDQTQEIYKAKTYWEEYQARHKEPVHNG